MTTMMAYSDLDELVCDSDPLDRFNKPADQDGDLIPDCIDSDRDGDGCAQYPRCFSRQFK